ncbi:unnamed protein product [Boreogadus saida]
MAAQIVVVIQTQLNTVKEKQELHLKLLLFNVIGAQGQICGSERTIGSWLTVDNKSKLIHVNPRSTRLVYMCPSQMLTRPS